MELTIRLETPQDYREVENLNREAFWKEGGCDEHYFMHKLRQIEEYIPSLGFVALHGARIVGNIAYMKNRVVDEEGVERWVLTFGPLAVLPVFQRQGIGEALVRHSADAARTMGWPGIVIFGHPTYYPRLGFVNAGQFGITTADGKNFDAFMAMELMPGAMQDICGRYMDHPVFHIDKEALAAFDKTFSKRLPVRGKEKAE